MLEPSPTEVARIEAGGYFGEMSLLTGEPRTRRRCSRSGDVVAVEIGADLFRRLAAVHPAAIEKIGVAAMVRRAGLEQMKPRRGRHADGRDDDAHDADEEIPAPELVHA